MVDNRNNQWEDMEYTEDNAEANEALEYDDGGAYDEEAVQDDNQEYESYEDEEYEEEADDDYRPKKKSPLPLIIIFLILLLAGAFIAVPKLMGPKEDVNVTSNSNQEQFFDNNSNQNNNNNNDGMLQEFDAQPQNQEDLAGSFFDAAGGQNNDMMSVSFNDNNQQQDMNTQPAPVVSQAQPGQGVNENDLFGTQDASNNENDSIMVVYNKAARLNPFKPPVLQDSIKKESPYETINNTQFEVIEPPTSTIQDDNLSKLLQTQISGILYDKDSPSAIVNLNGQDNFVKIGDVISGYKIVNITRDKVQINYKDNSYVASVGELFTQGDLDKQQSVANLENKFAGRYKNK